MLFLCTCSTSKDLEYKDNIISSVINDYISEFSKINKKEPNAILIRKRENSIISIEDLPQSTSMGYLRESMQKKDNLSAGIFSNVLCIYYLDEIGKDKIIFKDVPLRLQRKAEQPMFKIAMSGKELSIPYGSSEWEPSLEIKYELNISKKTVDDHTKRIEKTVDFP